MSKHKVSCAVFDPWPGPCDCSDPSDTDTDTDARVRRVMEAADDYGRDSSAIGHAIATQPLSVPERLRLQEKSRAELERVVRESVR